MSMLDQALAYASEGWPIFPCRQDKTPIGGVVPNGVLDATTDPVTIQKWWERYPSANIGFAVGEAGLVVLDLDPGMNLADLDTLNLPETELITQTPRGGEHRFYRLQPDEIVSPSASKIAPHIDVRSFNSYVLLPPSSTKDGDYAWKNPNWSGIIPFRTDEFVRVANSHREKDPERNNWVIKPDLQENVRDAIAWLKDNAKVAVKGQGGDSTAYATAAHLRSYGISEELALELMIEYWTPRCIPPWPSNERLITKVHNGYEYATSPPGNITRAFKEHNRKALFQQKLTENVKNDGSQVWELGRYVIRNRSAINHIPDPAWLIEGVIPEDAYCIMYAPETSFKTFLALDMALSVAVGFPRGPSQFSDAEICSPGPVLYITGEGLGNIRKRIEGWEKVHNEGNPVQGFNLFSPTPKLTDNIDDLREFILTVCGEYKLIVIDTISRTMQGMNENAQENASTFTALADALRSVGPGTSLLALHHVNRDGSIRGSSVFAADADVVLRIDDRQTIEADKLFSTSLTVIKMKDAPDQQEPLGYLLREIDLGEGKTTLVAEKSHTSDMVSTEPSSQDVTERHTTPANIRQSSNRPERSKANRKLLQSSKRRADHTIRRVMIETKALKILDGVAGKSWAMSSLATAVAHGLENVSASNARDHINDMKIDHESALHGRYDPVANRFK